MGRLSRHDRMVMERRTLLSETATAAALEPALEHRVVTGRLEQRVGEDEEGTFEGLALPWNTLDSYGTRFHSGCFSETLDSDLYAFLWMHDPWDVLGAFRAEERETGLWIAGAYDNTPAGQAGRVRARSGSAPGLSVGFIRLEVDEDDPNLITKARLVEVSQITARMQAVPGAGLTDARVRDEPTLEQKARRARARLALSLR